MLKLGAVLLVLPLLAVGCIAGEADVVEDDAKSDLKCDSIEVLDTETVDGQIERYRVYGCGREAVYECQRRRDDGRRTYYTCHQSSYRFPV